VTLGVHSQDSPQNRRSSNPTISSFVSHRYLELRASSSVSATYPLHLLLLASCRFISTIAATTNATLQAWMDLLFNADLLAFLLLTYELCLALHLPTKEMPAGCA